MTTWLISLYPQHARAILAGDKLLELRRSKVPAQPGDSVYLYATVPVGRVVGRFTVGAVVCDHPARLKTYATGLVPDADLVDWDGYYRDRALGWAVEVMHPRAVWGATLADMRAAGIQPPQGWVRYRSHSGRLQYDRHRPATSGSAGGPRY